MSTPRSERRSSGCALCGKPAKAEFTPFCSQGCRDRDLLNWLGDAYRLPAGRADPDGEENAALPLDSKGDPTL